MKTKVESKEFSEEEQQQVWEKGQVVQPNDPSVWRKDACGAWIKRSMYGDRSSQTNYGWEIDHIDPNGGDDISNLRPLQWYNNVTKSDGKLTCPITAEGTKNVKKGSS